MQAEEQLTALQAFDALIDFLKLNEREGPGKTIAQLLQELDYRSLIGGTPSTYLPGVWWDWSEAIRRAGEVEHQHKG